MNPIYVQHLDFRFEHPAKEEPSWKAVVERWYQLDAFAYGLAQAYTAWKPQFSSPPSRILLASPQASNETDFQFVRGGAQSPAKFVHTLPNIRCSPLCQVMQWAGPVLCIQKDPSTQLHGLREAAAWLDSPALIHGDGPVWVLSVFRADPAAPVYEAHAFVLSREPRRAGYKMSRSSGSLPVGRTDAELHGWLVSGSGSFSLPGSYELSKWE